MRIDLTKETFTGEKMEHSYDRPIAFRYERNDCTVRTVAMATGIPYAKVHAVLKQLGRKDCRRISFYRVADKVFEMLNITVRKVEEKRSKTQSKTLGIAQTFVRRDPKGTYICLKRGHAFPIIKGVVHDGMQPRSHIHMAWEVLKITKSEENGI